MNAAELTAKLETILTGSQLKRAKQAAARLAIIRGDLSAAGLSATRVSLDTHEGRTMLCALAVVIADEIKEAE